MISRKQLKLFIATLLAASLPLATASCGGTRVAEVQAARTAYELAEKQFARFEKLLESGDVSRSAYDQQKAQRDQLREQYQAALTQANQSYAAVQTARAAAESARVSVAQA